MASYEDWLYNNNYDTIPYEVVSIYHPSIGTHWLTAEPDGLTVVDENGDEQICRGVNMKPARASSSDDLDVVFNFSFSDVESELKDISDNIPIDTDSDVVIKYYLYTNKELSAPQYQPIRLIARQQQNNSDGTVVFDAIAPSLVDNRTGTTYNKEDYPCTAGFD